MILTYEQIETCADMVLRNYGGKVPIDIEHFARHHLGLCMQYRPLSDEGTILGLTTYAETDVNLGGQILHMPTNACLIECQLLENSRHDKSIKGRLRFTIAHECAHQILYRLGLLSPYAYIKVQDDHAYSLRELKSREDWNEWQANALAAALLMPSNAVRDRQHMKITRYGWRFNRQGAFAIDRLSQWFKVSKQAIIIRLQQLGLLEQRAEYEYYDPMEVWNDDYTT